jgi:beta-lactamase superfamily II metal-dependent hydrolase
MFCHFNSSCAIVLHRAAPNLDTLLKKQFVKDQTVPNGSSIAFLAEFGGKSALFLADAHPDVVAASVKRLCKERHITRLEVGAVKVSHHHKRSSPQTYQ